MKNLGKRTSSVVSRTLWRRNSQPELEAVDQNEEDGEKNRNLSLSTAIAINYSEMLKPWYVMQRKKKEKCELQVKYLYIHFPVSVNEPLLCVVTTLTIIKIWINKSGTRTQNHTPTNQIKKCKNIFVHIIEQQKRFQQ